MGMGDLGNAIIIIFIFSLVNLTILLSIGITRIKNNWSKYKCNPGVIPISGIFGYDPGTTFNECIKATQTDYMKIFLDPLYDSIGILSENGNLFIDVLESLKLDGLLQQNNTLNFASDFTQRAFNVSTEIQNTFIGLNDMMGKVNSMGSIIYYLVLSGIEVGKSMWQELPGTAIRIVT